VTFGSWLLPWRAELPVGLAVLCAFALGLVIGGLLSWSTGGRARRRARLAERRVESLERELSGLVRRAESAEREAITTALPQPGNGADRSPAAKESAAPGAARQ